MNISSLYLKLAVILCLLVISSGCHRERSEKLEFIVQTKKGTTFILHSEKEIYKYNWNEQRIFLKPEHLANVINKKIEDSAIFKLVFNKNTILEGVFIDASTVAFDISKPVIYTHVNNLYVDPRDFSYRIYDYENNSRIPVINNDMILPFLIKRHLCVVDP